MGCLALALAPQALPGGGTTPEAGGPIRPQDHEATIKVVRE